MGRRRAEAERTNERTNGRTKKERKEGDDDDELLMPSSSFRRTACVFPAVAASHSIARSLARQLTHSAATTRSARIMRIADGPSSYEVNHERQWLICEVELLSPSDPRRLCSVTRDFLATEFDEDRPGIGRRAAGRQR